MFNGQFAAGARVGEAVAGIGEKLADWSMRTQQAVNFGTLANAETKMGEAWALFQDDMAKEGDETKWADAWAKRSAEVEKTLGVGKAAPAIKAQLTASIANWKSTGSKAIGHQITQRQIERAKEQTLTAAETALKAGDQDTFLSTVNQAEKLGLLDPSDAEKMRRQGPSKADYYKAVGEMTNDPIGTLQALEEKTDGDRWRNFKALDPDARLTLLSHARRQVHQLQSDTYQDMIERTLAGAPLSSDEVQGLVDQGLITATKAASYTKSYLHGKVKGASIANDISSRITAYDPSLPDAPARYLELIGDIATAGLPTPMQEAAIGLLKEKNDINHPLNSPAAKDAFATIDDRFKAGVFGQFTESIFTAQGIKTRTDPQKYEEALSVRAKIEDATRAYIRANPKVSATDLQDFVRKQSANHAVHAARAVLGGALNLSQLAPTETNDTETAKARAKRLDEILSKAK